MHHLPRWVEKKLPHSYPHMLMHSASSDGNCFFASVQRILKSVGINLSILYLRRAVADCVLDKNNETANNTIRMWVDLARDALREGDATLLNEYRHVLPIVGYANPLCTESRVKLWQTMLTPAYWGEEFACRVVEEQLQMRFIIIGEGKVSQTWNDRTLPVLSYAILYLSNQHYNPVSLYGYFVFANTDLPYDVRRFAGL